MSTHQLHTRHQRKFHENRFVYPVLSRRSEGISIGVNLNPDKVCNFDCIYCQVNRRSQAVTRFVEIDELLVELDHMMWLIETEKLYTTGTFCQTPVELRRLNDIAFSGDGEPTTYTNFDDIVEQCAELKRGRGRDDVKMVLITNASMFHRPHVQRGLKTLDENNGEIWAKLESGTPDYYKLVERTSIPFQQILDNIAAAAIERPLVIQAMFMRIDGEPPSRTEQDAFCDRLIEITANGGQLSLIQIYTVARPPAESSVTPLRDSEVDAMVELVTGRTRLAVKGFYGTANESDHA